MIHRRRPLVLVLSAALLLSACGGAASAPAKPAASAPPAHSAQPAAPAETPPAPAPAAKPASLTFETAWIPVANQLPWYYALDKGYFRQAGLDVKIVSGKGSVVTAQQVGAGKAQIGQTDLTVMALARGKGEPLQAIYVEFPKSPFGVFAARSTGVKTFAQLKGHSVIVSAGSVETFLLPPTLRKVGLSMADIRQVNVSPATKDASYIKGQADALANEIPANAPFVDAKRPSNHLYFGSVLPVPYLGLFARSDYLKAHPAVVKAFVQAGAKALGRLIASPQAVQAAAAYVARTHGGVSAKLLVASWKDYAGFFRVPAQKGHPLGWMPPQMWQQTIGLLHRYAGLKGPLDPAAYYTNRFVTGG